MGRYRNVRVGTVGMRALDRYLSRPLDNFDFLKLAPREELLSYAHEHGMRFATECWHAQLVCFVIGMYCPQFAYFLKQSGGKSKIILDLIRFRLRTGQLRRALILVPELLHVASWEDQIKTHAPDLKYQLAVGSRSRRERLLSKQGDVVVMNYAGLQMFMTQRRQFTTRGNDGETVKKGRNVISSDMAASFMVDNGFNFCDIDEIHRITNPESTQYNLFRWCMAACDFKYIMTGTAFGRDPMPLHAQFDLIDNGETLGSLGMFKHAFFTPKKDHFKGVEWTFKKDSTADLHRIIKHRSVTYEVTEYRDMPSKVPIRIPLHMRGEQREFYERIVQGLIDVSGDYRTLDNVFVRMRQCASGFLAMRADDESRIEIEFKDNPKLEALRDFINNRDEKLLVFHEFRHSAAMIERMLEGERVKWAAVRGGIKDIAAEYQRFLKQDSCKVFLLNNQLGSESINPQYVCRRLIFYESPADPKRRDQAEMRIWRQGQQHTCWLHDLLMLGTVEEKILHYNRQGRDLLAAVMSGDESLIVDEEAA